MIQHTATSIPKEKESNSSKFQTSRAGQVSLLVDPWSRLIKGWQGSGTWPHQWEVRGQTGQVIFGLD